MQLFNQIITDIIAIIWHNYVLFTLLGTGVVLTFWSGFSQYRALTHGWRVLRGHYDDPDAPGAINHFQALSGSGPADTRIQQQWRRERNGGAPFAEAHRLKGC